MVISISKDYAVWHFQPRISCPLSMTMSTLFFFLSFHPFSPLPRRTKLYAFSFGVMRCGGASVYSLGGWMGYFTTSCFVHIQSCVCLIVPFSSFPFKHREQTKISLLSLRPNIQPLALLVPCNKNKGNTTKSQWGPHRSM